MFYVTNGKTNKIKFYKTITANLLIIFLKKFFLLASSRAVINQLTQKTSQIK